MSAQEEGRCLLLDSLDTPIAYGKIEPYPDAHYFRVRVLDGQVGEVLRHQEIHAVFAGEEEKGLSGRILQRDGDVLVLERLQTLGKSLRKNLRMPVAFHSFLYPITGDWKGRCAVKSVNLSCGGIAFYCSQDLKEGELTEMVIPITSKPLVVTCQILSKKPSIEQPILYRGKFVLQCHEEEMMIREAVFSVQLSSRTPSGRRV